MEFLINRSMNLNESIEIIYMKGDGTFSKRSILVKENNVDQIKAFCLLKNQPRIFKKDSILAASPIKPYGRGLLYA